jgi:hypothetical protein
VLRARFVSRFVSVAIVLVTILIVAVAPSSAAANNQTINGRFWGTQIR